MSPSTENAKHALNLWWLNERKKKNILTSKCVYRCLENVCACQNQMWRRWNDNAENIAKHIKYSKSWTFNQNMNVREATSTPSLHGIACDRCIILATEASISNAISMVKKGDLNKWISDHFLCHLCVTSMIFEIDDDFMSKNDKEMIWTNMQEELACFIFKAHSVYNINTKRRFNPKNPREMIVV